VWGTETVQHTDSTKFHVSQELIDSAIAKATGKMTAAETAATCSMDLGRI